MWSDIADAQAGVISRAQALAAGMSPAAVDHRLLTGRWVRAVPGVYRTFTGPPSDQATAWAVVRYAGAGATLDAAPSLWLAGGRNMPPASWPVLGLPVTTSIRLGDWAHPSAAPPRLRVEPAVLRATQTMTSPQQVVDVVIAATSSRRTTAARLSAEIDQWPRLRWRPLLVELVEDVDDGVASALERHWRRDVELAHGLPHGLRNHAELIHGRRRYRDLRYEPFAVVAELDGRAAHPETGAFRDRQRDNAAAGSLELGVPSTAGTRWSDTPVGARVSWPGCCAPAAGPADLAGAVPRAVRSPPEPILLRRSARRIPLP